MARSSRRHLMDRQNCWDHFHEGRFRKDGGRLLRKESANLSCRHPLRRALHPNQIFGSELVGPPPLLHLLQAEWTEALAILEVIEPGYGRRGRNRGGGRPYDDWSRSRRADGVPAGGGLRAGQRCIWGILSSYPQTRLLPRNFYRIQGI